MNRQTGPSPPKKVRPPGGEGVPEDRLVAEGAALERVEHAAGVSTRFVVDVLGPGELDDEDTPIGPRWLFGLGLPVGGIVALDAVGATGPALFASVGGAVSVVLDGLGDLGEPVERAAVTLLFGILLVALVRLVL